MLYPFYKGNVWLSTQCNVILISSWIIGSLLSSVSFYNTTTISFQWENETYYDCRGAELDEHWTKVYTTSIFILTFALPLIIQTYSYGAIGRKLITDRLRNNELPLRRNTLNNGTAKVN